MYCAEPLLTGSDIFHETKLEDKLGICFAEHMLGISDTYVKPGAVQAVGEGIGMLEEGARSHGCRRSARLGLKPPPQGHIPLACHTVKVLVELRCT